MSKSGIYIASKTHHAPRWKTLRACGFPVCSTWIDEAGRGETISFPDLWVRCVREASTASALVLYVEPGDVLKGAFIEVGAALACNVPVFAFGTDPTWSFVKHPLVKVCASLAEALDCANALARTNSD